MSVFSAAAQLKNSFHLGFRNADEGDISSSSGSGNGEDKAHSKTHQLSSAPSGIPTDIHVPELVFGDQIPSGKHVARPEIIPFSIYAPCRLLDVNPDCPVSLQKHSKRSVEDFGSLQNLNFDVLKSRGSQAMET